MVRLFFGYPGFTDVSDETYFDLADIVVAQMSAYQ